MRFVSGTKLDERVIRCDLDPGFRDGRQYGRGKSGGQVRDEYRQEYDAGRGGWGHNRMREQEERERHEKRSALYQESSHAGAGANAHDAPVGAEGQYFEHDRDTRSGAVDGDAPSAKRAIDDVDEAGNSATEVRRAEHTALTNSHGGASMKQKINARSRRRH